MTYTFTSQQLDKMLDGLIDLFIEYRDVHGYDEDAAKLHAAGDTIEALQFDRELVRLDGERPMLQVLDNAGDAYKNAALIARNVGDVAISLIKSGDSLGAIRAICEIQDQADRAMQAARVDATTTNEEATKC